MGQNYQDHQLGFDRTQLYKEHIQPQITRSSALRAVIDFCLLNQIKITNKELVRMTERYIEFIETGNKSWIDSMDKYISDNKLKEPETVSY